MRSWKDLAEILAKIFPGQRLLLRAPHLLWRKTNPKFIPGGVLSFNSINSVLYGTVANATSQNQYP